MENLMVYLTYTNLETDVNLMFTIMKPLTKNDYVKDVAFLMK